MWMNRAGAGKVEYYDKEKIAGSERSMNGYINSDRLQAYLPAFDFWTERILIFASAGPHWEDSPEKHGRIPSLCGWQGVKIHWLTNPLGGGKMHAWLFMT